MHKNQFQVDAKPYMRAKTMKLLEKEERVPAKPWDGKGYFKLNLISSLNIKENTDKLEYIKNFGLSEDILK